MGATADSRVSGLGGGPIPPYPSNTGGWNVIYYTYSNKGGVMGLPVVISGGWDLQAFTANWDMPLFDSDHFNLLIDRLRRAKGKYEVVEVDGNQFRLPGYKPGGYYAFLNENLNIWINPSLNPTLKAQIHSVGVHRYGVDVLQDIVRGVVRFFGGVPEGDFKLFRQDFFVDLHVDEISVKPENVLSRAKKIRVVHDPLLRVETLGVGTRGKETVFCRMYDKRKEMEETKKYWYQAILDEKPLYEKERPVWRVEFEIGGLYLRQLDLRGWEKLKEQEGHLLDHLFHKTVRLVHPNFDDSNKSKNPLLPEWQVIQKWIAEQYPGWSFILQRGAKVRTLEQLKKSKQEQLIDAILAYRAVRQLLGDEEKHIQGSIESLSYMTRIPFGYERLEKKKSRLLVVDKLKNDGCSDEVGE